MIPVLLGGVLLLLAGVHVYWACGGAWGKAVVIPEVDGRPLFRPARGVTLLVAVGLLGATLVALTRGAIFWEAFPGSPTHWITIALALAFVLRSIGEFRYVGFFKRVRGSRFATWDTWLFSPLSLLLGLGFLFVATM